MKTNHTISFDLNNDIQESNEDYKSRYIEDEEELAKLKQQIKNYSSELLKKMQKNDDENTFLTDEDEEEKRKRKRIFIPQSRADFESLRIKYPKYSPHILPYISPNKVKSPSQRFRQRWSYIEQETKKNDDANHYDVNDDIIFTHSDDEDFSLNSSNLTPIKKNTTEINQRTNINSPQSTNQANSLFNGSPNSTGSEYYQQSPKSQKQHNYSTSDQEPSSSVIQTQKFKIQNQEIKPKEEKQPESPTSKLAKFRKEFEADFPLSNSELEHDTADNIADSQNSGNKLDFIIEEEEEEISDEMSSILKSPKFIEEEEKNEMQYKANNTSINNSHEGKNKIHSINEDLNLKDSNKEGSKNKIDSKPTCFNPSQFSEEEEEINFDDDLNNNEQNDNEVDLYNEEESQIEVDLNIEKQNQFQSQGKTENANQKFDIQIEEESANEFGIDFNEEDENENQSQINNQSPKQHISQSEEESSIDFKINADEVDEEESQPENQRIFNINTDNKEKTIDDFGIDINEEDEDENQTINQAKNKIQNKPVLNNNKEEEESKSDIIMDIYEDDDETKIENQAAGLNFSSQNEDESKTEFMIDLNETNEEEDSNIIYHPNVKTQNHQTLSNNEEKDDDFDSSSKNLSSSPKNEIDKKNEISPDRKTKEYLNFETPKFPKGADSFLESS